MSKTTVVRVAIVRVAIACAVLGVAACDRPSDVMPGCRCEGDVPGGRLSVECGGTQCLGGVGYRCTGPNAAVDDPAACATDGGTGPACGDGRCDPGETCAADCGSGARCGDGTCDSGETRSSCPDDCNRAPSVEIVDAPSTGEAGDALSITLRGSDPDGDPVEFHWTVPETMTGLVEDEVLSWSLPLEIGPYTLRVRAVDSHGASSEQIAITIDVTARRWNYGSQDVAWSPSWTDITATIQDFLRSGYSLTIMTRGLNEGVDVYVAVVTMGLGYSDQVWDEDANITELQSTVSRLSSGGRVLVNLTNASGAWYSVWRRDAELRQRVVWGSTHEEFTDALRACSAEGLSLRQVIRAVEGGPRVYVGVCEGESARGALPASWWTGITTWSDLESWLGDMERTHGPSRVTSVDHADGFYSAVLSHGPFDEAEAGSTGMWDEDRRFAHGSSGIPGELIRTYWGTGHRIVDMTHRPDGRWNVVMSR